MGRIRLSRALVALAAWTLVGCASSADSGGTASGTSYPPGGGPYYGGQTGSLTCLPPETGMTTVPVGDGAFIYYPPSCDPTAVGRLALLASDGKQIAVSYEPIGNNGAVLVRADQTLTAGSYSIAVTSEVVSESGDAGASRPATPGDAGTVETSSAMEASSPVETLGTVEVAEESPLPTALGTVMVMPASGSCGYEQLVIQLSDAAIAYAPLLELSVGFGNRTPGVYVPYGTLTHQDGQVVIDVNSCAGGCLPNGPQEVTVVAKIAGEDIDPLTATAMFQVHCDSSEATTSCAVAPAPRTPRSPTGPLLPLAMVGLWFYRRRNTTPKASRPR